MGIACIGNFESFGKSKRPIVLGRSDHIEHRTSRRGESCADSRPDPCPRVSFDPSLGKRMDTTIPPHPACLLVQPSPQLLTCRCNAILFMLLIFQFYTKGSECYADRWKRLVTPRAPNHSPPSHDHVSSVIDSSLSVHTQTHIHALLQSIIGTGGLSCLSSRGKHSPGFLYLSSNSKLELQTPTWTRTWT